MKKISWRKHGLTDEGAERIADGLARNTVLEVLDVAANKIARAGAAAFAQSFFENQTLKGWSICFDIDD